jgi:DNA-directed RNA polymerase subunit H (RpoH/RPB5)
MELIPKHELLSEGSAKEITKKFNIQIEKFPKIYESDPQAKKLGATPGQLIAVQREGPLGKYTFYRFVIKG